MLRPPPLPFAPVLPLAFSIAFRAALAHAPCPSSCRSAKYVRARVFRARRCVSHGVVPPDSAPVHKTVESYSFFKPLLIFFFLFFKTTGKEPMIKFTGDVVTLGRKPDSTLRLRGTHFSGKHCSIYRGSDVRMSILILYAGMAVAFYFAIKHFQHVSPAPLQ